MLLIIGVFSLFSTIFCNSIDTTASNTTLYYFGYGSNLLAKRIHIKNPSAVFYGPAKLKNYRLDFVRYYEDWNGAVATIVEDDEEELWGALWTLNIDQIKYLDEQEEVNENMYVAKTVAVTTLDGKQIMARTYQETINPTKIKKGECGPMDRRPSSTYLAVITLGAIESNLPAEWIAYLFSIPSNGQMASVTMRESLGYPY